LACENNGAGARIVCRAIEKNFRDLLSQLNAHRGSLAAFAT